MPTAPTLRKAKVKREKTHRRCEIFFKTDDGNPWRLNAMPFFVPIYDGETDRLVLLTSRQSTKTTYLRNVAALRAMDFKGNSALYIAPTNTQVGDFSRKKLDRIFDYTPELKAAFVNRQCTWNVLLKEFNTRSTITLRSTGGAQGADRVRGNTANDIFLDEFQSLLEEDIPVIEECAATFDGRNGRKRAFYVYTGTPLSSQNPLQKQFNLSRQWEWHIQCPHCSLPTGKAGKMEKGWQKPIGMHGLDKTKDFLWCSNCGRNMYRKRGQAKKFDPEYYDDTLGRIVPHGKWCSHNPQGVFDGYRVVRLMMPWSRWRTKMGDGVLDRWENWPERRFKNEVMALPHDEGTMPITERSIRAICGEYALPKSDSEIEAVAQANQAYVCYAGLDWAMSFKKAGKMDDTASYTIFSVWAQVGDKLKLIFAHRFRGAGSNDGFFVANKVAKWMRMFRIRRLGADYGVGYHFDLELQRIFGEERVAIFHYKDGAQSPTCTYSENEKKWMIPRTRMLDQLCDDIQRGKLMLPKYEDAQEFTNDWLRLTIELTRTTRALRYGHTGTDDFVHCASYAVMAKRLDRREGDFSSSSTIAGVRQTESGLVIPDGHEDMVDYLHTHGVPNDLDDDHYDSEWNVGLSHDY